MLKLLPFALILLAVSAEARRGWTSDYRVGDEWGKKRVTSENLASASPMFRRTAMATAYLPIGGTAFYLGRFAGKHVIATNHHVCPVESDCVGNPAEFRMLGKKFQVTQLFVTLPDIDLSLLEIKVRLKDEESLQRVAQNFAFDKPITKGMELLTIGFGIGGNANNNMMANMDSDCKVFSEKDEFRHLADPDDINPGNYKSWSFAHACDISHGDSGSAMVDRNSGDIVGIVWTGKLPKSSIAQSSLNLSKMYESSSPLIWKELSYAVPAVKIREHLKATAESGRVALDVSDLLLEIVK